MRVLNLQQEKGLHLRVPLHYPIMAWIVRHSGWLIVRLAFQQATGRIAYQGLRGRPHWGELAQIGEALWGILPGERRQKAESQWRKGRARGHSRMPGLSDRKASSPEKNKRIFSKVLQIDRKKTHMQENSRTYKTMNSWDKVEHLRFGCRKFWKGARMRQSGRVLMS